ARWISHRATDQRRRFLVPSIEIGPNDLAGRRNLERAADLRLRDQQIAVRQMLVIAHRCGVETLIFAVAVEDRDLSRRGIDLENPASAEFLAARAVAAIVEDRDPSARQKVRIVLAQVWT